MRYSCRIRPNEARQKIQCTERFNDIGCFAESLTVLRCVESMDMGDDVMIWTGPEERDDRITHEFLIWWLSIWNHTIIKTS